MKRSFVLLLSTFFALPLCMAQTSSGNMMAGGSLSFYSVSRQSGSTNDYSGFEFSPSFGYFVSDGFAVGTSLTMSTWRSGTGSNKSTGSSFSLGPFARYYMFTSNDRFAIFGQAGLGFGAGKTDPPAGNVTRSNSFSFSVFPGAVYFFNDHWALELSIDGLSIVSSDPDTDNGNDKVTRVNFGLSSFSPNLGFRYHF